MPALLPHRRCAARGLLDLWKPNRNAKFPLNSKPPSNKPWTTTSPSATIAAWRCIAIIAMPAPLPPATAKVRIQIPVFRCGQCRRMAGGMTLLGQEMRHQRFSKKTVTSLSAWPRRD